MQNINKIILKGQLGTMRIQNVHDKRIVTFSLAVTYESVTPDGYPMQETTWHCVSAYEGKDIDPKIFDSAKGQEIYVEGRIRQMKYTTIDGTEKTYTEILASQLKILEKDDRIPDIDKRTIDTWIWWCLNFTHPEEFIAKITDGECMKKHLMGKWNEKYHSYGPIAAMQQFYLDLDEKHRSRLIGYIDTIKKDKI